MNTASTRAYVSKRKLERYQEERKKILEKISQGLPIEEAAKYESSEDEAQQVEEIKGGEMGKESKTSKRRVSIGRTDNFVRNRRLSVCDNESDEDVDSDELGDDIGGTRQQPQQMQMGIQPQQLMQMNYQPQLQMQIGAQPQQQMMSQVPNQLNFQTQKLKNQNRLSGSGSDSGDDQIQQMQQKVPEKEPGLFGRFINLFKSDAKKKVQTKMPGKKFQNEKQVPNKQVMFAPPTQSSVPSGEKFKQKVDTNVFQVSMSCLKDSTYELATGDPIECKLCKGIFNMYSVLAEEEGKQLWTCEFCNHKNFVEIDPEEKPKTAAVSYILESAPQVKVKDEEEKKQIGGTEGAAKDISIVYCIDVSGSMSGGRINSVKKTILAQIKDMEENHPQRRVGIVTFTDIVDIIGDGTVKSSPIQGEQLNDYDFLLKNSTTGASNLLSKPIKETYQDLKKRVENINATNSTALGPGMLSAIGLASLGSLGSQIIVCTDGASNLGIGSSRSQPQIYSKIGEFAKDKGVTCHIVTFKGTECNIDSISVVSGMTNGEIERVDIGNLGDNFKDFLSRAVIATKVQLKVKLHAGLEFRNELLTNLSMNETILMKDFGNVNEETDLCFEYQMKPLRDLLKLTDIDFSTMTKFPFQAQIHFTALDGSRQVRVITQYLDISTDKEDLKKNADFAILGVNAIQQSTKMAREGDYKRAQAAAKAWNKVMTRDATKLSEEQNVQIEAYRQNIGETYNLMHQQQQSVKANQGMQTKVDDRISQNFYQANRINKSKWTKTQSK